MLLGVLCVGGCVAGVGWYFLRPIVADTLQAGRGGASPGVAARQYLDSFNDERDTDIGISALLCPQERRRLLAQRREYVEAMKADEARWGQAVRLRIVGWHYDPDPKGDRAPVVADVTVDATYREDNGRYVTYASGAQSWRFDTRRFHDGWRICRVEVPAWCGVYRKC
jgi:hypothetical protein